MFHYIVVVEVCQEDESPMILPPCGIFSSIELAREYIKETFENTSITDPWNPQFDCEMHKSGGEFGTWEEIYIWGREVDER